MTDEKTDFQIDAVSLDDQPTDIIEQAQQRFVESVNDHIERYIERAVADTEWSECEYLDVVVVDRCDPPTDPAALTDEEMYGLSFEVYRWDRTEPPSIERYYSEVDSGKRVYRLTEGTCRLYDIDPQTGQFP